MFLNSQHPGRHRGQRKVTTMVHISKPDAAAKSRSWRDVLPIHPAAKLFPPMIADELRALAADIGRNGI